MHHSCPDNLRPATLFADTAALSPTGRADHIYLGAWFGKREVAPAEAYTLSLAEHLLSEALQTTFKVRHCTMFIDQQAFDLVEHRLMCGINGLVAIGLPRCHNTYWRLHLLHCADLHGGSLSTQQDLAGYDPEGILHIAGGMIRLNLERLEVIIIRLHLWPLHH